MESSKDELLNSGFFGVGAINLKNSHNYGSLFRTANILGASFIFLIGTRFKPQTSDTSFAHKNLPLFIYDTFEDFQKGRPYGCQLVVIEMTENATPLYKFEHPKQACYLLGAEDYGIPKEVLPHAQHVVVLEGCMSMNVAVAGSIVLHDRVSKLKYM